MICADRRPAGDVGVHGFDVVGGEDARDLQGHGDVEARQERLFDLRVDGSLGALHGERRAGGESSGPGHRPLADVLGRTDLGRYAES